MHDDLSEGCGQLCPAIDETTADRLSQDLRTTQIMDALEWRILPQSELERRFPDSGGLIGTMLDVGIIKHVNGGLTLAEPYHGRPRSEDVYWFLVSDKRDWGASFEVTVKAIAGSLIALMFGSEAEHDPIADEILDRVRGECPEKIGIAAEQVFGAIAMLISDEEPSELLKRWTAPSDADVDLLSR